MLIHLLNFSSNHLIQGWASHVINLYGLAKNLSVPSQRDSNGLEMPRSREDSLRRVVFQLGKTVSYFSISFETQQFYVLRQL